VSNAIAIETNRLDKRYGVLAAVTDLSLRVGKGEIYAFLGLNGAGKTTTIRLLLGMVRPSAGTASVLGVPIGRKAGPWNRVGYLVETPRAYPELSVRENLDVMRRLRPGTPAPAVPRIIEQMGLADWADRRTSTLSTGNAQRLGLARALLHDPELLILDEPANGLDPAGIVEIRHLLIGLARERGVTVFLSSHNLGEVARLAQRIGIIHRGRLLQELNTNQLERNRQRRLIVGVRNPRAALEVLRAAGHQAALRDNTIEITDRAAIERPDDIASQLVHAGHPPLRLDVEQEDLEQYFLRLVGLSAEAST
jgi:ABC-2 type transport system ATP-binding protein